VRPLYRGRVRHGGPRALTNSRDIFASERANERSNEVTGLIIPAETSTLRRVHASILLLAYSSVAILSVDTAVNDLSRFFSELSHGHSEHLKWTWRHLKRETFERFWEAIVGDKDKARESRSIEYIVGEIEGDISEIELDLWQCWTRYHVGPRTDGKCATFRSFRMRLRSERFMRWREVRERTPRREETEDCRPRASVAPVPLADGTISIAPKATAIVLHCLYANLWRFYERFLRYLVFIWFVIQLIDLS